MKDYLNWVSLELSSDYQLTANNQCQTSKSILEYTLTVESQDDYGLPLIPGSTHRRTAHLSPFHTADIQDDEQVNGLLKALGFCGNLLYRKG